MNQNQALDALVKVIKRVKAHNEMVQELDGIDPEFFVISLLDDVLDAFGIPADDTVAKMDQHDTGDLIEAAHRAANDPETFCRDRWHEDYYDLDSEDDNAIREFLVGLAIDAARFRKEGTSKGGRA